MKTKLVAVAALALIASISPAQAIDGARAVNEGYVVSVESFDLHSAEGRQDFVQTLDRVAVRLCADGQTRGERLDCQQTVLDQAMAEMSPALRAATETARTEQNAVQLAATR